MFAIIKTGGKQYKVSPGDKIKIEKIEIPEGEKEVFDQVLLVGDPSTGSGQVKIGQPLVAGAKVEGIVLKQGRGKKIIIFKYKAKKREKVKRGHRQSFTEVEIKDIKI